MIPMTLIPDKTTTILDLSIFSFFIDEDGVKKKKEHYFFLFKSFALELETSNRIMSLVVRIVQLLNISPKSLFITSFMFEVRFIFSSLLRASSLSELPGPGRPRDPRLLGWDSRSPAPPPPPPTLRNPSLRHWLPIMLSKSVRRLNTELTRFFASTRLH